ncbi:MAG: ATP-binding protein [Ilumatobacteraceae bacterium]
MLPERTHPARRRIGLVFVVTAVALLVGGLMVGGLLFRQTRQLQRSVGITEEIVNANVRALGQVQRELLRLQVLVESGSADAEALSLHEAFVSQRMIEATLSYQLQTLGTDELLDEARSLARQWDKETKPLVDQLVAAPTRVDDADRAELSARITTLELGFNQLVSDGEVNRKGQAGIANDASTKLLASARRLLVGLVVMWSGFLLFVMVGWYVYHRLSRQRQEANECLVSLNAEARKLSLVASRTDNLVIITDGNGLVEWVNDAFTRVTGYTIDDVKGMSPGARLQGPGTDPATIRYMRERISLGEPFHCEVLNYTKGGKDYWVDLDVQPIVGEAGKIVNFIAVQADVTERRQFEEHLRRAKEDAEQFAEEKANFLASMSHEIRTPLNSVLGFTELLLGTELTETQREYASTARESGAILLDGLNNILNFSALESGRVELDVQHFDVEALLHSTVTTVKPDALRRGLEVRVVVDPGLLPIALGDPTRLRQILVNLLSNAVKFTEVGEVVLRASMGDAAPGGGQQQLLLSVTDTGIGIGADHLSRLFRPFTQGDASITRRYGGTGLGLAISRHLASMMGGEITVESTPGSGTTFRLALPVLPGDPALVQRESDVRSPSGARGVGPVSVLLVEDDSINQRVASHMLARLGYRARVVGNGEQALAALRLQTYDLVLMDLHMPVMDGITATKRIRATLPATRQPMIVGLTASALVGDRERVLRAGMDGYLSKPVQMSDLAAALDAAGSGTKRQRPAAPNVDGRIGTEALDRTTALPAVDVAAFEHRMGPIEDARGLLFELVPTFIDETSGLLEQLAHAVAAADLQGLQQLAHRLKGTASAVAASAMASTAEVFETSVNTGERWRARELLATLESQLADIREWFVEATGPTASRATSAEHASR